MSSKRRWVPLLAGAAVVGVIAVTSAVAYPVVTQAADSTAGAVARSHRGGWEQSAALAEALGISEEELAAAVDMARQAAIDQAVADGRLTQEQADALAERDMGRLGRHRFGAESDTLLAEALGVTVDELSAARTQAFAAQLAQAVADGDMTQAQADLMLAQRAYRAYQTEQVQADTEAAIQAAVEAGAITQAQADLLLSNIGQGFGGFGRGGFGHGFMDQGFGGPRGHGFEDDEMFRGRDLPGGDRRGIPGQGSDDTHEKTEESAPQSSSSVTAPDAVDF